VIERRTLGKYPSSSPGNVTIVEDQSLRASFSDWMITMEAMEGGEGGFWSYSGYIYMTLRLDRVQGKWVVEWGW